MKNTLLLAWELGGGTGHMHNLASIGIGLRDRGWSPVVAARTLQTAERIVGHTGFPIYQAPLLVDRTSEYTGAAISYAELLGRVGYTDVDFVAGQLKAWQVIIDAIRPQCMIVDHAPGALLAAHILGVPAGSVGTGFTIPPHSEPMPGLLNSRETSQPRLITVEKRVLGCINQALKKLGKNPLECLADMVTCKSDYIFSYPELDHYPDRVGGSFWGAIETAKSAPGPDWPTAEGKRIFVYYHPDYPLADFLAEQLNRIRLPCFWVAPGISDQHRVRIESATLKVSPHPVNLAQVAREASMTICHGGHGVCAEMLREGHPLLILPHYVEQTVLANRLAMQTLAITLSSGENELSDMINETLSLDKLHKNARNFAKHYKDMDPAEQLKKVLDDIEKEFGCRD